MGGDATFLGAASGSEDKAAGAFHGLKLERGGDVLEELNVAED